MIKEFGFLDNMSTDYIPDIVKKLAETLSARSKVSITDITRQPSAVLIPVYFRSGEYYMIFTRRSELVHHHKGEISFPGGGFNQNDGTLLNTALRESFEEIGLEPKQVTVLGELDDMPTKGSPFIITPFVGFIQSELKFKLSVFEISELIEIPIKALNEGGCRREEPLELFEGKQITPYVYAYADKLITGATARILKQFLEIFTRIAA